MLLFYICIKHERRLPPYRVPYQTSMRRSMKTSQRSADSGFDQKYDAGMSHAYSDMDCRYIISLCRAFPSPADDNLHIAENVKQSINIELS
jgi:hypothetical protein